MKYFLILPNDINIGHENVEVNFYLHDESLLIGKFLEYIKVVTIKTALFYTNVLYFLRIFKHLFSIHNNN